MKDSEVAACRVIYTWASPHEITACQIVHVFECSGRIYYVVCTRAEPAPPILAIREADQFFREDEIKKFFGAL